MVVVMDKAEVAGAVAADMTIQAAAGTGC